jgi:hypothetical protein
MSTAAIQSNGPSHLGEKVAVVSKTRLRREGRMRRPLLDTLQRNATSPRPSPQGERKQAIRGDGARG